MLLTRRGWTVDVHSVPYINKLHSALSEGSSSLLCVTTKVLWFFQGHSGTDITFWLGCDWILEQFSINCWKTKDTAQQNTVYWHRYCDKDLISHESLHSTKTNGISPRQIKLQVSNSLQVASRFKNFFTKTIALTEIIGLTFTPGQIEVEILCCGGKKRRVNT